MPVDELGCRPFGEGIADDPAIKSNGKKTLREDEVFDLSYSTMSVVEQ